MAKPRNKLIDLAQYLGLRLFAMLLFSVSFETNLRVARGLGRLMYWLDAEHRRRALENLGYSFPQMSESRRRQITLRSMQNLLTLFVEVLFTTRLVRLETWADICQLENFQPVLELLLKRDQGLIMLTGHYGNWEILGYVLATLGFTTTTVARPLDNKYINRWLLGVRERRGQKIIAKTGAVEEVTQALSHDGAVGFMADQNAGKKGIFVDFFGRKASTYKSIGLLAMSYKIPVIVGYARRTGPGFRFALGMQDIIHPSDWENQDDPLLYITQRYTKAIEDFVLKDPSQYLWIHRRWKTRPKNESAVLG
jgi:Kdo2-lipid IVA lauroyltransferase/acyltransferase